MALTAIASWSYWEPQLYRLTSASGGRPGATWLHPPMQPPLPPPRPIRKGGNGCANDAAAFLGSNAPSATMTLCTTGSATHRRRNRHGERRRRRWTSTSAGPLAWIPILRSSSTTVRWGRPSAPPASAQSDFASMHSTHSSRVPNSTQTLEISYDEQGSGSGQIELLRKRQPGRQLGHRRFRERPNSAAQIKDELLQRLPASRLHGDDRW